MQFYVKDVMSPDVISIQKTAKIKDLIKLLADKNIMGVPVIDDDCFVVGVVSTSDLAKSENSYNYFRDSFAVNFPGGIYSTNDSFLFKSVETIMTKDLYTIDEDEGISHMAKMMYQKQIHRLLVTKNGKLCGIVTTFDLLKLLASSEGNLEL